MTGCLLLLFVHVAIVVPDFGPLTSGSRDFKFVIDSLFSSIQVFSLS